MYQVVRKPNARVRLEPWEEDTAYGRIERYWRFNLRHIDNVDRHGKGRFWHRKSINLNVLARSSGVGFDNEMFIEPGYNLRYYETVVY